MLSVWLAFCDCGFHSGGFGIIVLASVCPLRDDVKRQASLWEGLAVGKTGSCSGGQGHAQLIFNPVVCCGWTVLPSY